MSVQSTLETAIREKRAVHLNYGGDPREVCPHALGLRDGVHHVLVYQYAGRSRTGRIVPGSHENWRCMALDKITDATIVMDEWQTAKNIERPQTCLDTILLEVD